MNIQKAAGTFFRVLGVSLLRKSYPLLVNIRVTNRCNHECIYCNVPHRQCDELSESEIYSVIDMIEHQCVFINLYGGEPLVRNDIGNIIDYISKKNGIFLSLSSNGTLVPDRISELEKLNLLLLSLDGPPAVHDKHKGQGSYDHVMKAIACARARNIPVVVMTAISRYNIRHFDHILEKAREMDFNVVFQPVISGAQDNSEAYPPIEEFHALVARMIKTKEPRLSSMSKKTLQYYLKWPHHVEDEIDCLVERISCFLDADGSLFPCTSLCDIDYGSNIRREPVNSIRPCGINRAFRNLSKTHCNQCWAVDSVEINKNPFLLSALKRLILKKV